MAPLSSMSIALASATASSGTLANALTLPLQLALAELRESLLLVVADADSQTPDAALQIVTSESVRRITTFLLNQMSVAKQGLQRYTSHRRISCNIARSFHLYYVVDVPGSLSAPQCPSHTDSTVSVIHHPHACPPALVKPPISTNHPPGRRCKGTASSLGLFVCPR